MGFITFVGAGGSSGSSGGTYAQRGAAGTPGRRFTTTDCLMNDWFDDGSEWRPVLCGVIGVEPPLTGTFVNSVNPGASVLTQYSGSFTLKGVNDGGTAIFRGFTQNFSNATAFVEAQFMLTHEPNTGGYPGHNICMRESSSGKMYTLGLTNHAGASGNNFPETGVWASSTSRSATGGWAAPGPDNSLFLRIRRDASNIYADVSRNRTVWVTYETRSLTSVFDVAPNEIGIGCYGYNVTPRMVVTHFTSGSL